MPDPFASASYRLEAMARALDAVTRASAVFGLQDATEKTGRALLTAIRNLVTPT